MHQPHRFQLDLEGAEVYWKEHAPESSSGTTPETTPETTLDSSNHCLTSHKGAQNFSHSQFELQVFTVEDDHRWNAVSTDTSTSTGHWSDK